MKYNHSPTITGQEYGFSRRLGVRGDKNPRAETRRAEDADLESRRMSAVK